MLGAKRTSISGGWMSAFSQEETFVSEESPALAGHSFHVEFSSSDAVLGEVTYSAGAANGLGISMSLVRGHSRISSGMWPSGYHSLGSISLASTVSLITS